MKNKALPANTQKVPDQSSSKTQSDINNPAKPDGNGVPEDSIRHRAYLKWMDAGSPECDGVEFWLAAEMEHQQDGQERDGQA